MPAPTLTTVIDEFTGDGALGAQWATTYIQDATATTVQRVANAAKATAVGSAWLTANYGPDCEFTYTITAVPADGAYIVLAARGTDFGTASWQGYYAVVLQNAADSTWEMRKRVGEVVTTMQAPTGARLAVGDKVAVRIVGSAIEMWHWRAATSAWVQVGTTQTDTALTAAGKHGVEFGDTAVALDTLTGGTVTGATTTTTLRPNATISNAWTLTGPATAHEALDEAVTQPTVPDTTGDHVSTSTAGAVCEVGVADKTLASGESVSETKLWVHAAGGSKRSITVDLRHGSTSLGTVTVAAAAAAGWVSVTSTVALTQAQVNDLRARLTANSTGGGGTTAATVYAAYVDLATVTTSTTIDAAATLTTGAALTAGARTEQPTGAALTAGASLTAGAQVEQPASVAMTTGATVTATGVVQVPDTLAAAALATGATLTAGASLEQSAGASLQTGAALAAAATLEEAAAATLTTGTMLTAAAVGTVDAAATLTAGATLAAGAATELAASATLSTGALLTADAAVEVSAAASLSTGALTTTAAQVEVPAAAVLTTGANTAAGATVEALAAAALTTGAILAAATDATVPETLAAAVLTTGALLTAAGIAETPAAAALATGAALTAGATIEEHAAAALTIGATLVAATRLETPASAALQTGATLTAAGALEFLAAASMQIGAYSTARGIVLDHAATLLVTGAILQVVAYFDVKGPAARIQRDPAARIAPTRFVRGGSTAPARIVR